MFCPQLSPYQVGKSVLVQVLHYTLFTSFGLCKLFVFVCNVTQVRDYLVSTFLVMLALKHGCKYWMATTLVLSETSEPLSD